MYSWMLEWPIDRTKRSRPVHCGSFGSCFIHFWNSRYAVGAMLIAVPGWPLPTFCTASIARTRTVSTAVRSRSPKPSARVGCGCRGDPVGVSVAASAGASASVLLVPLSLVIWRSVLPRDRSESDPPGGAGGNPPRADDGAHHGRPGRAVGESEAWALRRHRRPPYPLHGQSQRDQTLVVPGCARRGA